MLRRRKKRIRPAVAIDTRNLEMPGGARRRREFIRPDWPHSAWMTDREDRGVVGIAHLIESL
jgi:hypothetical protein